MGSVVGDGADSTRLVPAVNPAVIYRSLTEGAVLFSTENEVYFGLNSVGARVWELMANGQRDFDGLCHAVAAEYPDAPRDELRRDIQELLDDLAANRLISAGRAGSSAAGDGDGAAQKGDAARRR